MRSLVATLLLAPATALAGAYAIPTQSPRDLALQQSATAEQHGPEAVMNNLAALAGQEGVSIAAAVQMIDNVTDWSDPTLGSESTLTHPVYPPTAALAWGGKLGNGMPYGLGAGFVVGGGGSMFWPESWAGSTRIQEVDQRFFHARGGGAIGLGKGFKLGAAVVFYRITETLSQEVNFVSSTGMAEVGLAGNGWSWAASAEWQVPGIPLKLGVDYRHQGDLTLEGSAHFTDVPPPYQTVLQDQGATQKTTVPSEFFVGASWTFAPGLRLMGAYSFENWSVYQSDTFVGDKGFTVTVPRDYNDAWVYRLGSEWENPSWAKPLSLRLGIQRSVSEQPTDTISPSLSDASSWGFSAGAGWQITPSFRVDAAYMLALLDEVTATGSEAFPGTYSTTVHFLALGVTWRSGR
jgi:long-chain fatty acid transport protein